MDAGTLFTIIVGFLTAGLVGFSFGHTVADNQWIKLVHDYKKEIDHYKILLEAYQSLDEKINTNIIGEK